MDNIHDHPRHVVASIWHGLQREWEFKGFAHRTREMFERSATKFMRNRKMQLKYKCRRALDGSKPSSELGVKPDDVNGVFSMKIADLTKNSKKMSTSASSSQSLLKGKDKVLEGEEVDKEATLLPLVC